MTKFEPLIVILLAFFASGCTIAVNNDTTGVSDIHALKVQLETAGASSAADSANDRAIYDNVQTAYNVWLSSLEIDAKAKGYNLLWPFSQVKMSSADITQAASYVELKKQVNRMNPVAPSGEVSDVLGLIGKAIKALYDARTQGTDLLVRQLEACKAQNWDQLQHKHK